MYNVKIGQLVLISWNDVTTFAGWYDPKKAKLHKCDTVGYVADIRDDVVVVSNGVMNKKYNSDPTIIPWSLITSIEIIEIE